MVLNEDVHHFIVRHGAIERDFDVRVELAMLGGLEDKQW
jgi:hypothetical protein